LRSGGYGFRARNFVAPRNDEDSGAGAAIIHQLTCPTGKSVARFWPRRRGTKQPWLQKRVRGKTDFASHFNPLGLFKARLKK
jgi:hypothetical protein